MNKILKSQGCAISRTRVIWQNVPFKITEFTMNAQWWSPSEELQYGGRKGVKTYGIYFDYLKGFLLSFELATIVFMSVHVVPNKRYIYFWWKLRTATSKTKERCTRAHFALQQGFFFVLRERKLQTAYLLCSPLFYSVRGTWIASDEKQNHEERGSESDHTKTLFKLWSSLVGRPVFFISFITFALSGSALILLTCIRAERQVLIFTIVNIVLCTHVSYAEQNLNPIFKVKILTYMKLVNDVYEINSFMQFIYAMAYRRQKRQSRTDTWSLLRSSSV